MKRRSLFVKNGWSCKNVNVPLWSVRHVSERTEDWQRALIATIFQIHATAPEREDILAFLTGTVHTVHPNSFCKDPQMTCTHGGIRLIYSPKITGAF